jgi:acyl-[acyl-carrier-protein]-phospholipid O-acyltransferase/long-chain-fatty-acid--[acyl-carrier-protein] ligase
MNLFHNRLFSSFTYLNITQFLGALNDNIYKLLVVYFLINLQGIENSPLILSLSGAIFVLPFLLFSTSSGILADRFSKRNIIVLTKILELVIIAFGILAFAFESIVGSYLVLFALATQSALFGPSKYGIIPELVSSEKISEANGVMSSFTFIAIILGTFLASFITDVTGKDFVLAILVCIFVAILGVFTSYCIEFTPPSGSTKRFNVFFFKEIISTLTLAKQYPSLITAILGSSFFMFLGAYMQLNLIPYAVSSLNLTDIQGGYLFLITALGIGLGSFLAGKISGRAPELGLVPLAGIGAGLSCLLLYLFSNHLLAVIPLVILAGMFGGLFAIPQDAFIQVASPNDTRGQIIATNNFIAFLGVLLASALLYVNTQILNLSPATGFLIVGILTLMMSTFIGIKNFDYFSRFLGMILAKLHFKTTENGKETVPETAVFFICEQKSCSDILLLLASKRLRIRFFAEESIKHEIPFLDKLYAFLKIKIIANKLTTEVCKEMKECLKQNISVCLLTKKGGRKTGDLPQIKKLLEETKVPLVEVTIEKEKRNGLFSSRWQVPAHMTFHHLNLFADKQEKLR